MCNLTEANIYLIKFQKEKCMKKLTVIVMLIGAVSSFSTGSGEIFREIGQEQQLQTYYDVDRKSVV